MATFVHGKKFDRTFETALGPVRVGARVSIDGGHLTLYDFEIFPRKVSRLRIGMHELLEILRWIKQSAKAEGFTELTVDAERLSGANPERIIKKHRRLT